MMIQYFENSATKEQIRWDPAQIRNNGILLPGRAGINHWHRIDTKRQGSYLDANGKNCLISEERSVIAPKEQKNVNTDDISYDETIIDGIKRKVITLLDCVTTNWLHDSIIDSIKTYDEVIEINFIFFNDSKNKLTISFIRSDGILEKKILIIF